MSLYLKYRPQSFSTLVGQENIANSFHNSISKNIFAHAYLFCGPRGTGKTTTARLVAKAINCIQIKENAEPCNECEICVGINNGSLTDVIEIDAASNRGIDEMRELRETVKFAPNHAKNKVYIIDEVHMLTNEAFNALLKTLEEPPLNVYFILATTEVHKIPATIISRCQRFDFRRISESDIFHRLSEIAKTENIEYEDDALKLIADYTDGGLRDAISMLDQLSISGKITAENTRYLVGASGQFVVNNFLEFLIEKNEMAALDIIVNLFNQGADLKQFQTDLLKLCRKKLFASISQNDQAAKSDLVVLMELIVNHQELYRNAILPQLSLEMLVVKFCNKSVTPKPVPKPEPVSKPVPKSELVPTPVPEPVQKVEPQTLVDADYQKQWANFLKRINKPMLLRSFEQGKIVSTNANMVEIGFSSDFHYNFINKAENIKIAEDILSELSGNQTIVKLVKNLEDVVPAAANLSEELDSDDIAELFGGEAV